MLFDVTTEISESAKLAEEYRAKIVECSARIESCVGKLRGLNAELWTCNKHLAASAEQSIGIVRSSSDSLLPVDGSSRWNGSVGAAVPNLPIAEWLKIEQLQLLSRCDRLLAFSQLYAGQMEQSDDEVQFRQQNVPITHDVESDLDRVLLLSDSVRNSSAMVRRDTVDNFTCSNSADASFQPSVLSSLSHTAGDSESEVVRTHRHKKSKSAAQNCAVANDTAARVQDSVSGFIPMNSTEDAVQSAVVPSKSAQTASTLNDKVEPIAAEFKSPQECRRGRQRSRRNLGVRSISADSSLHSLRSGSSESISAGSSKTHAEKPPAQISKSVSFYNIQEEFKSPQACPRGRQKKRQDVTIRASSAGNSRRSLTHSDPSQSADSVKTKPRRQRSKFTMQNSVEHNNIMVHQDNVDDVAYLNSADTLVESTSLSSPSLAAGSGESEVVKSRRNKRSKSTTQNSNVGNDNVTVHQDLVDDVPSSSAKDSVNFTSLSTRPQVAQPAGSMDDNTVAEFKSPLASTRGRQKKRQDVTIRASSAGNSRRSLSRSDPSEAASAGSSVTKRTRQRSKSTTQNKVENNVMVRQDNVDDVSYLKSADTLVESTLLSSPSLAAGSGESEVVKSRRNKRSKSAAQNSNVGNVNVTVQQDNVSDVARWSSAEDLIRSTIFTASVDDNAQADFKSPQARPRGRQRKRQDATIRSNSAVNSRRSFPSTVSITPMSSHHSVTTCLSGPQTDIIQQYQQQSPVSPNSGISPASTSTPAIAARYVTAAFACHMLISMVDSTKVLCPLFDNTI